MADKIENSLPDPDSNVQLGEGAVPPSQILGGEITTQFIYRPDHTSFAMAVNTVRLDQEAMCGYRLIMVKQRSVEAADADGKYTEVFVTFAPYPTVDPEIVARDPSLQPQTSPLEATTPDHLLPPAT